MQSSEEDSSSNEAATKKSSKDSGKRKRYFQKYNSKWEQDRNFKHWISKSKKGDLFFYCKACACDYSTVGGKRDLRKHEAGVKHVSRVKAAKIQVPMDVALQNTNKSAKQIKEAEIRMAAYAVEHNIAFNTMQHLTQLIKCICPDNAVVQGINCGRTKCTKIVQNVTGRHGFEEVVSAIRKNRFSLLVDESTDVSAVKNLALVVRFPHENRVVDAFLALIPVADVTAQGLYDTVVNFFAEHNIPYKENLIGLASDGASNVSGVHKSLAALLKRDIPDLFLMKCICHSFALCASYACEKIPRVVEDVARDVYNYLHISFKRQTELKEFQDFIGVKPHKLLQPSQTRWLSLLQVIKRLLEQYDALVLYFTNAVLADKVLAADMILNRMTQPYVKMYLQFLEFVLPFLNGLNLEMQSEDAKIHVLHERVTTVFKSLLDCFIKRDYLKRTALENVNFNDPHNFVVIDNMYLGAKLTAVISNNNHGLNSAALLDFRQRCLQFYIEACYQIKKRFNFNDASVMLIRELAIISPQNVLKGECASIAPLASKFPRLVAANHLNALDAEWRELRNFELNPANASSCCQFWTMIYDLKRGDGTQCFPLLSRFALSLLALPHSTAAVERLFSQINLNKNKIRNRLETKTLAGILHTKYLMGSSECYKLPVDSQLLSKHNILMYEYDKT